MEAKYVFDSSAVIAILRQEKGGERCAELCEDAIVSAVNHSEVVAKLIDWGYSEAIARSALSALNLSIVDFDSGQSFKAGVLRGTTRSKGLSLGDRACIALAKATGRTAITADRAWADLGVGVAIELIR